jgi:hypothetical protein
MSRKRSRGGVSFAAMFWSRSLAKWVLIASVSRRRKFRLLLGLAIGAGKVRRLAASGLGIGCSGRPIEASKAAAICYDRFMSDRRHSIHRGKLIVLADPGKRLTDEATGHGAKTAEIGRA